MEPDLLEHPGDAPLVIRRGIVRGTGEGKFQFCKPERLRGAALDDRDGLERFSGGAEITQLIDIACRGNEISFDVDDRSNAPMDAFDDVAPGDLGKNGRDLFSFSRSCHPMTSVSANGCG